MRLMITGGGTGGHVYPALAIASAVQELQPNSQIMYVGSNRGMERDLVRGLEMQAAFLDVSGLMRKSPLEIMAGVSRAGRAFWRARALVRSFRPQAVVGTGGYVSGPVVLAGALAGVPVVLQEQNAYPGVTNRWLSRWATHVCLAFEAARTHFPKAKRVSVTGNPLRKEFLVTNRQEARKQLGIHEEQLVILITGGSLGARVIAETAVRLLCSEHIPQQVKVIFGTGNNYHTWVLRELASYGIEVVENGNIMVRPYIHDMHLAMTAADLALCRAGAVTVSELAACGLPAVLIPSSNVAHNEQEHNARVLADAGAAVLLIETNDVIEKAVPVVVGLLHDRARLLEMRRRCLEQAKPDAAATIARLLLEYAKTR